MINKAKKSKRIFSLVAIASALAAIITTALVILLILKQIYIPMWFILGVSAVCFYTFVLCTFAAIDRGTAMRVIAEIEALGTYETEPLAEKLGWNKKATEKFVKKLIKWGYIA